MYKGLTDDLWLYTFTYTHVLHKYLLYMYIHVCTYILYLCASTGFLIHGVATTSRLLKIIGLFCRISSPLEGSFAKETYNFMDPTNWSHPLWRTLCDMPHVWVKSWHIYEWVMSPISLCDASLWMYCAGEHENDCRFFFFSIYARDWGHSAQTRQVCLMSHTWRTLCDMPCIYMYTHIYTDI